MAVSWPIKFLDQGNQVLHPIKLQRSFYPSGRMAIFMTDSHSILHELSVDRQKVEVNPGEFLVEKTGDKRAVLESLRSSGAFVSVRQDAGLGVEVWMIAGIGQIWSFEDYFVVQEAARYLFINIDKIQEMYGYPSMEEIRNIYEDTLGVLNGNYGLDLMVLIKCLTYLVENFDSYQRCFWVAGISGPQVTKRMVEKTLKLFEYCQDWP